MAVQREVALLFYNIMRFSLWVNNKITVCTNLSCALREGVNQWRIIYKRNLEIRHKNEYLARRTDYTLSGECMGACAGILQY